jgi:methylenetetrahydrofolate dehydrogenase (NADP+)/methenyltetrahydrofolate cyclohydrolase/formyltetrahydrofolate synthetase
MYIRMKTRAANEVGIEVKHIQLPRTTSQSELLTAIDSINENPKIHGLLVQVTNFILLL